MNYIAYFEQLARECKAISHTDNSPKFSEMELMEAEVKLRTQVDTETPCLFVAENTFVISDLLSDNPHKVPNLTLIIAQSARNQDFEGIQEVINRCELIAYQLFSRIQLDTQRRGTDGRLIITEFLRAGIRGERIYNMPSPTDYGVLFTFSANISNSLAKELYYKPENWN